MRTKHFFENSQKILSLTVPAFEKMKEVTEVVPNSDKIRILLERTHHFLTRFVFYFGKHIPTVPENTNSECKLQLCVEEKKKATQKTTGHAPLSLIHVDETFF